MALVALFLVNLIAGIMVTKVALNAGFFVNAVALAVKNKCFAIHLLDIPGKIIFLFFYMAFVASGRSAGRICVAFYAEFVKKSGSVKSLVTISAFFYAFRIIFFMVAGCAGYF